MPFSVQLFHSIFLMGRYKHLKNVFDKLFPSCFLCGILKQCEVDFLPTSISAAAIYDLTKWCWDQGRTADVADCNEYFMLLKRYLEIDLWFMNFRAMGCVSSYVICNIKEQGLWYLGLELVGFVMQQFCLRKWITVYHLQLILCFLQFSQRVNYFKDMPP